MAVRNAATIIFKVMGGKEDIDKIWPLGEKEKKRIQQPDAEWWAKMKTAQNRVNQQILEQRHKHQNNG